MKIAIVHDWLVTDAGAEKVLRAMIDIYPHADIFSLVDFLNDEDRKVVLNGKYARTSFIQKLPFAKKHFRNYLPLFPKAIESFDLKNYDLIISSSWAVAKGVKRHKGQVHISYCYTPIRYAWDLYDEYTSQLKQPKKFVVQMTLKYIRNWDIKTLERVDYFIADSKFVQDRIKKTYNRDSLVIYPPVDVENYTLCEEKEEFYLSASRLVPYKKTKLIVEAFNKMPHRKLVVIGDGEDFENIKAIAKNNTTLLGYQEKKILIDYMQRAKAFVYAAVEDFGIIPIEALACGTPVIALNNGATAETIAHKINGIHFKNQNAEDIIYTINEFESLKFNLKEISEKAQTYSIHRFKKEIEDFVVSKIT
ncbi:Glycosyltransferase involved in cell wall bisynthesis [Epsilonproteobacteria bacterium SCGC AD-308-O04]|nr:Glycosyltransferase involved in cell wall bisynthesis [Epsilonproteobacteria bacterium SCGC AD-308-O04]